MITKTHSARFSEDECVWCGDRACEQHCSACGEARYSHMRSPKKLHWVRQKAGLRYEYVTEEQLDGVPDFLIVKHGNSYKMKMRSSAQWMLFASLTDAKRYAESL